MTHLEEIEKRLLESLNGTDDKYFDLSKLPKKFLDNENAKRAGFRSNAAIAVRKSGEYTYKAFYLGSLYDWEIIKDDQNADCLLVTRNGEYLNLEQLRNWFFTMSQARSAGFYDRAFLKVRSFGSLRNKAFFLGYTGSNWKLERDTQNILCLIPTKDEKINNRI